MDKIEYLRVNTELDRLFVEVDLLDNLYRLNKKERKEVLPILTAMESFQNLSISTESIGSRILHVINAIWEHIKSLFTHILSMFKRKPKENLNHIYENMSKQRQRLDEKIKNGEFDFKFGKSFNFDWDAIHKKARDKGAYTDDWFDDLKSERERAKKEKEEVYKLKITYYTPESLAVDRYLTFLHINNVVTDHINYVVSNHQEVAIEESEISEIVTHSISVDQLTKIGINIKKDTTHIDIINSNKMGEKEPKTIEQMITLIPKYTKLDYDLDELWRKLSKSAYGSQGVIVGIQERIPKSEEKSLITEDDAIKVRAVSGMLKALMVDARYLKEITEDTLSMKKSVVALGTDLGKIKILGTVSPNLKSKYKAI